MSESTFRVGDEPDSLAVDEMFAPPTPDEVASLPPLEALRQALAAPVERDPLTLRVPTRPGVTLRFVPNIDDERRRAWQARATKKSRRQGKDDELNEMLFASLVLANTHVATCFGGVDAHDEEDGPLTFAHRQLWDMVGATDPQSCIRKLFANDAHVLIASGEVLLASGFEDDLEESDPTEG
jgi:hypothetical protein